MRLSVRLLVVLAALTSSCSCLAQTGTVTFYSANFPVKDQLKVAVTVKGTMPFTGWVFDAREALAHFQTGHFISLRLPSGLHSFSVSYTAKQPGKTQLIQLNIESGHNYCVRLSQKYVNMIVLPVGHVRGFIEAVSCKQAFREAGDSKPLEIKRVKKSAQGMLDTSDKFPDVDR